MANAKTRYLAVGVKHQDSISSIYRSQALPELEHEYDLFIVITEILFFHRFRGRADPKR